MITFIACSAVSRESLVGSISNNSDFNSCLPLIGIIFGNLIAVLAIASIFFVLKKYTHGIFALNSENQPAWAEFVVSATQTALFLAQQGIFIWLMVIYLPITNLDFDLSLILFAFGICFICVQGICAGAIKWMNVFSSSLSSFVQSCIYTQYTMALVGVFYKNYANFNTYTRYQSESAQYKTNMRSNQIQWSTQAQSAQQTNFNNEVALKQQIGSLMYSLNNLPTYTNSLASQVSSKQALINSALTNSNSLLVSVQSQSQALSNPSISNNKLNFYNANPLYYNDYVSYINGTSQLNALNQINYFLASFSPSEILALLNMQNSQFTSLLNLFLQLQGVMDSLYGYTPQTNTAALFEYLSFQNQISYTNKLAAKIDFNILFTCNNQSAINAIALTSTLSSFLSCNSFSQSHQNSFDYIVMNNINYGVGFSLGNNIYCICMNINNCNYCFLFQNSNTSLILSSNGWALNYSNYFNLLDIIKSQITTASPIVLANNNAYYSLEEDHSFSQGMMMSTTTVSSSYIFPGVIDNIGWSFQGGSNFFLRNLGISISFDKANISVTSNNSLQPATLFSLQSGSFNLSTNGSVLSGTCNSLVF